MLLKTARRRRAGVVVALLALGLVGCAPAPVTTEARDVKSLYDTFMLAAVGVFVIVAGLISWSIVRYRQGARGRLPSQFHTNVPAEIVWWSLPTLLVIGLFVISGQVLGTVDASAPASPLTVKVEGSQWQWRFTYPNGAQITTLPDTASEVPLPVGRPIRFELTSPDVIHSFYVPQFLIKRDAIPGIANEITLTIDQEGTYTGQCAEFCGLLHADMRFTIRAVSSDAFDAWLRQQPAANS